VLKLFENTHLKSDSLVVSFKLNTVIYKEENFIKIPFITEKSEKKGCTVCNLHYKHVQAPAYILFN
jgi:hypothetical protein